MIWPDKDRLFKLARDSATAGAETFRFEIKTDQSRAVNASFGAKLKGLGLELGGEYKRWEDLTFSVEARFASRTTNTTD